MSGDLDLAVARLTAAGVPLDAAAPDPSADTLDALDAVGFTVPERDLRLSVYAFAGWGDGQDRVATVEAHGSARGLLVRTAVAGTLLCYGTAPVGDVAARFVLNDLVAAVAGAE